MLIHFSLCIVYKALCCQITTSETNGTTNPWAGHNNLTEQTLQNAKLLGNHSFRGHSLEPENGPIVLYSHCLGGTAYGNRVAAWYSDIQETIIQRKSKPESKRDRTLIWFLLLNFSTYWHLHLLSIKTPFPFREEDAVATVVSKIPSFTVSIREYLLNSAARL